MCRSMPISTSSAAVTWIGLCTDRAAALIRAVWCGSMTRIGADPYYDDLGFTLDPDHYRVVVTLAEDSQVVVDAEFDVVECVTVENGCHTVTFTNPAGQSGGTGPVQRGPNRGLARSGSS